MNIEKESTAWIVYSNEDLTEGRGREIPIHVCWSKTTASRLAEKAGVQGSRARINEVKIFQMQTGPHRSDWLAPVQIVEPSKADEINDDLERKKQDAIARMREAGISREEAEQLAEAIRGPK